MVKSKLIDLLEDRNSAKLLILIYTQISMVFMMVKFLLSSLFGILFFICTS